MMVIVAGFRPSGASLIPSPVDGGSVMCYRLGFDEGQMTKRLKGMALMGGGVQ